ncbi:MAG: cofactor-independent phosphoglycerate mutase [Thermodesulfobacteriota bacterium]
MKYVILIGDGMSDEPIESLGSKTPLDYACTPNLDSLAATGRFGLFESVPQGYAPGSDVANMSILGYDPAKYYTGRAPLEAASIGVKLGANDTAFRCNLVTLTEGAGPKLMEDYSAGHISTDEAREIILDLDEHFKGHGVRFYPGTSYRHLMVWENAPEGIYKRLKTTPPHDISDQVISEHLPEGEGGDKLRELIELSQDFLAGHAVNIERFSEGVNPATSIWLWGQGVAPQMPTLSERFGVKGSIISAVDLMKGLGVYAGLEVVKVPGVTGYIDTNYKGKVEYALKALQGEMDFVCVHVEAPDEAGHQGKLDDKLRAIEDFDGEIVGRVLEGLQEFAEYRVLALTDHPTPVQLKTHTSDAVPFALATSEELRAGKGSAKFSEKEAAETGILVDDCEVFAEEFFGKAAKA